MWAAGRWGVPPPSSDPRIPGDCRSKSRSRPTSSSSVVRAGSPGRETGPLDRLSPPMSFSNSTLSLLSPLSHQGFPFDQEEEEENEEDLDQDARLSEAQVESLRGMDLQGCASNVPGSEDNQEQNIARLQETSLTPWELWFVGKEKEERGRLQQKALEERKEREQKINKEMEEKAAEELKKEHLKEKAKEKYEEWLKKKKAEECERKKKEKEKEKQRQAELQEKKEIAEQKFKEWLENAKCKPCPVVKSYGYANGKVTGFHGGNSYPEPAFYNPIPWKPIHMPPPREAKDLSGKKTKRPVTSQPHRSSPLVIHKARDNLCLGTLGIQR
ncbi:coiled-coil domain-containing protein 34 isoform X2 [Sorex araneus]|uniref:coiled-coil domain-containing protein 34 isoform X2 n=1 Tax=Sorex araneus TaxID=42254 RepID=UPI00243377D9|nr:coiled-coil domain-containing protein 34 isoform X2 [Sorex araneus]